MRIAYFAGVVTLMVLAGCQPEATPSPLASMNCGEAKLVDTAKGQRCVKPMADAGKVCTTNNQCSLMCLAETGTCAPYLPYFGCHEVLINGKGGQTVCVD